MKSQHGFLLVSALVMTLVMTWTGAHLLYQSRLDILMAGAYQSLAQSDHQLETELNRLSAEPELFPQNPEERQLLDIVPCHRFVGDQAFCQLWLLEVKHQEFRGQLYRRRTILQEISPSDNS